MMQLRFWGVRSDIAIPGRSTLKYGGNTLCATVIDDQGNLCILDAGTGLIPLGRELVKQEFGSGEGQALFLISHGHWDHTQGIGFFTPFYIRDNRFTFVGAGSEELAFYDTLESQLSPALSPLQSLNHLLARLAFRETDGQSFQWGTLEIQVQRLPGSAKPGMDYTPLGFRLNQGERSLVYIATIEYPAEELPDDIVAFAAGADLLIHEAYFGMYDYQPGWGHSSVSLAVKLAQKARIPRLALYHFNPTDTDDHIDQMVKNCQQLANNTAGSPLEVMAAREGQQLII